LIERVAGDDWKALDALGIDASRRRDVHSIWRHLALAASNGDRAQLLGAFLIPRRVRGSIRAMIAYTIARLRTRFGALGGTTRVYGTDPRLPSTTEARPLQLDREEMVSFTRDIVRAGGGLHVRAPGGSMLPTIPRGALVRIGPVPAIGITRGDVVLALTSDGEPVLHRAIAVHEDRIVMRGDAAIHVDPAVASDRVIGVATHVLYDGTARPLGRRPRRSISISALKVRRRLARIVGRAR